MNALDTKRARQVRGHLRACGLEHWYPALTGWLNHYAGIETIVDDERDGPVASVLHLLRTMTRLRARPSDAAFAALLSDLEFLYYRVRRSDRTPPSFEAAETWSPLDHENLPDWSSGYALGGWHSGDPPVSPELISRRLLNSVRRQRAP